MEDSSPSLSAPPPSTKKYINNEAGLLKKLEEIAYPATMPWVETLVETVAVPSEFGDAEDDLKREVHFYSQALKSVKSAISKFHDSNIPYRRPADYFAQMYKSDEHMSRVKSKILFEQKAVKLVEKRKRRRAERKFAKKAQSNKLQEKSAMRRNEEEAIEQWKQGMDHSEKSLDDALHNIRHRNSDNNGRPTKSKKRERRDAKYGFGGQKRVNKRNTRESLDEPYKRKKRSGPGGGGGGGGGNMRNATKKKGGKQNRPGKARRAKSRAKGGKR